MNVFFDVHGTLISGGKPRPHTREVFAALVESGHHVYLWSTAGPSYARGAARLLGVEDLVFGYYSKYDHIPVTVDFFVDDHPDFADHSNGYAIRPFDGAPEDAELRKILEELT
ncbi:MAG TPA: hypothetical protein VFJ72_01985 [Rubrobacteraceae bacterium]|nr:hypothetical protein [Rubrobacteraceae bacterium]